MNFTENQILVTNAEELLGYKIVEVRGLVIGITVRSRGLGGNIITSLRSLVGGEIKEYIELAEQARLQALQRMIDNARTLGTNAVINVRFDSNEPAQNMDEIIAYGTAVIVTKTS